MTDIEFHILQPGQQEKFQIIADWYLSEWKIPIDQTICRLQNITADNSQFQALVTKDKVPITTGGLYNYVSILDKEPRLKMYKKWLALVYTKPDQRKKGYGSLICNFIQDQSKIMGLNSIYLYTDTAERLYKSLGWNELERMVLGSRNIVIMTKDVKKQNNCSNG